MTGVQTCALPIFPVVASDLVISVAQVFQFGFDAQRLGWLWLECLGWLICAFAVYAVTTFVSVCVGTVFDTLVFSGVLLLSMPVPHIVARGRKGGSNVAAAICNALLYLASGDARE